MFGVSRFECGCFTACTSSVYTCTGCFNADTIHQFLYTQVWAFPHLGKKKQEQVLHASMQLHQHDCWAPRQKLKANHTIMQMSLLWFIASDITCCFFFPHNEWVYLFNFAMTHSRLRYTIPKSRQVLQLEGSQHTFLHFAMTHCHI